MKCALYIENGLQQVVLTPQTRAERDILALIHECKIVDVKKGSFYECRGGYVRHASNDDSTMLVLTDQRDEQNPEG